MVTPLKAREVWKRMSKAKGLTEREKRMLEFLVVSKYAPSIRELGDAAGVSSTSVVNYYLDRMIKKGFVEKGLRGQSRSVRITPAGVAFLYGQPLGDLLLCPHCGMPIENFGKGLRSAKSSKDSIQMPVAA